MSAQRSAPQSAESHQPKRRRGYLRVAAILEAGVEVFTEKGYDAATMTEIAARSGTAIGSLYRFFPSKESLADALLLRYAQQIAEGLAELEQRARTLSISNLADALVDFMLALQAQRSFAIILMDARGGTEDRRAQFREAMRGGVAKILRRANPTLTPTKCMAMAIVLLSVFKGAANADREKPAMGRMLLAEIRKLVRTYLAAASNSE